MIAVIDVMAVACAVYPKRKWKLARPGGDGLRPVAFYLVVGILAAVASRVLSLLFALALDPGKAWEQFGRSYPWLLMSFVTATTTAFLTDDRPGRLLTRARLRWAEALGQALVSLVGAVVVYYWLQSIQPPPAPGRQGPPMLMILTLSTVIGFAIGYFVPTWYREAPYRADRRLGERRTHSAGHDPERRRVDRRTSLAPVDVAPAPAVAAPVAIADVAAVTAAGAAK
jgi:hypothetical protein